MRRVLCFFVVSILLLTICEANACSWDRTVSRDQLFAQATSVFIGHIVQTKEVEDSIDGQRQMIVEGVVGVVEMLKGPPPADGKIRSRIYGPGNCTIPILAGTDYLLFIHQDNLISYPGGSRALPPLRRTFRTLRPATLEKPSTTERWTLISDFSS
jgi:hypothetical protein